MGNKEVQAYQNYIRSLIEEVKKVAARKDDISEYKRLLESLIQAVKEGDWELADYLIEMINENLNQEKAASGKWGREIKLEKVEEDFDKKDEEKVEKKKELKTYFKPGVKSNQFHLTPLKILSITLVFILLTGSLAYASSKAVPESFLYPIKRNLEKVKLYMTTDLEKKAYLYAEFSQNRLREANFLLEKGEKEKAKEILEEMEEQMQKSLKLGFNNQEIVTRIRALSQRKEAALQKVMEITSQEAERKKTITPSQKEKVELSQTPKVKSPQEKKKEQENLNKKELRPNTNANQSSLNSSSQKENKSSQDKKGEIKSNRTNK